MKIIADEAIIFIKEYFSDKGELILKPGRHLSHEDVKEADMLIARSVTPIDQKLLNNTRVKFVGSVVTGQDHINLPWLKQQGIEFAAAEGCNAVAVLDYVIAVVAALQEDNVLKQKNMRAAVIGVGRIGNLVADKLKLLGFDILLCDPIRAEQEKDFISTPLDEIADVDFITLHTPLTQQGNYPTFKMIEKKFLQRQRSGCVLLNTGRGAVIDFANLKQYGKYIHWCLDVWENEPNIDLEVLKQVYLGTPHIAGHTLQSKLRAIQMIYQAAFPNDPLPVVSVAKKKLTFEKNPERWQEVVLSVYDPRVTSLHMRQALIQKIQTFDQLRNNFNFRYEYQSVEVPALSLDSSQIAILNKL